MNENLKAAIPALREFVEEGEKTIARVKEILAEEPETQCGKPCSPEAPCEECEGYWQRMVAEGYWNRERHRWTEKGWHGIMLMRIC